MTTSIIEADPAVLAAAWRDGAEGSPAGPLFTGRYTESELTIVDTVDTDCGPCTGSHTIECY